MWFGRFVVLSIVLAACHTQEDPGVLESAMKFMAQCGDQGIISCAKERVLKSMKEITEKSEIEITPGVVMKKSNDTTTVEKTQEEDPKLPEESQARELAVDNQLVDHAINFLTTHTLEFKIPKDTADDMKRSLDEARKRKKKKVKKLLLPLLLLLKLKAAILLPIIFGAIAFVAFKALIVAKIALVISLVSALKKLLSSKFKKDDYEIVAHPQISHSHLTSFGEDHGHGHGHGHYGRAMEADPQVLAYSAHVGQ